MYIQAKSHQLPLSLQLGARYCGKTTVEVIKHARLIAVDAYALAVGLMVLLVPADHVMKFMDGVSCYEVPYRVYRSLPPR